MKKIIMPQFGETENEEILINKWLKKVNDHVNVGEPLFEVESNKAIMQVESVEEGILYEISKDEGQVVKPGETVCTLKDTGELLRSD